MNQGGKLLVYPNPTLNGQFSFMAGNMEGTVLIRLLDMNGRMVQQWERTGGREMTLQFNQSGVYILQVQEKNSGRMMSQKLMIGR